MREWKSLWIVLLSGNKTSQPKHRHKDRFPNLGETKEGNDGHSGLADDDRAIAGRTQGAAITSAIRDGVVSETIRVDWQTQSRHTHATVKLVNSLAARVLRRNMRAENPLYGCEDLGVMCACV